MTSIRSRIKALVPLSMKRLRPKLVAYGRRVRWWHRRLPTVQFEEITDWPAARHYADPILEGVCMPPYAGSALEDFGVLMSLVEWLQPAVVLELGTAWGNTVANICRLAPEARVYTVNAPPDRVSGNITTCVLGEAEIGWVYRKYGYAGRVEQILENTLELDLSEHFSKPIVDLAIIDACHDTEYVINDFLLVQPFVRIGGLVLLHDSHPSMSRHYYGSYRACMLLRQKGYDIRQLADTTWAICMSG